MIAIIDYGAGNLSSVANALAKLGQKTRIIDNPRDVVSAAGIILPGVGAFETSIRCLRKSGMDQAILECLAKEVPLLGICLGFQMLFSVSYENGEHQGLEIFPGAVRRLPAGVKVPHMGWNQLEIENPSPLLRGIEDKSFFYFVHSYYVEPEDPALITAYTTYGCHFTSMVGRGNVYGVQFHPEKSSDLGLLLLKNFGEMVKNADNSGH
jgi:glutamine amidotransferase